MAPAQGVAGPVMLAGAAGTLLGVTLSVAGLLVSQALAAETLTVPAPVPTVAVMEEVVEVPVHPDGSVHPYEVAPVTGATLYVCVVPAQGAVGPVIAPGTPGRGVTFIVTEALLVAGVAQGAEEASVTATTSPLASVVDEYVAPVTPGTVPPLTVHT